MLVTEEAFDQSFALDPDYPDWFPWSGGFRASPRVDWGAASQCTDGYIDFNVLPSCRAYYPPMPPDDLIRRMPYPKRENWAGDLGQVTLGPTTARGPAVRFVIDPLAPGGTRPLTEEEQGMVMPPEGGGQFPCEEGFFTDNQCEIKLVPTLGVIGGVFLATFLLVRRMKR